MSDPKIEEDDYPDEMDDDECWNCGGEGVVYSCLDEIGCVNPEDGCDMCRRTCEVCGGKCR